MKFNLITFMIMLNFRTIVFSQSFVNANFDSGTIVPDLTSPYYPYAVYAANAIPGWTAYIGGSSQTDILYNDQPLSNAGISLQGTNGVYEPIQGQYFVLLQGQFNPSGVPSYTNSAAIGQTGLIPINAESLIFWANITVGGPYVNNLQVTFDGQTIDFSSVGSGTDYTIYEANVSAFAGQTGQLLFTVPYNGSVSLDNIQFSSSPVPEPSALGLSALGSLFLTWRRWRK